LDGRNEMRKMAFQMEEKARTKYKIADILERKGIFLATA
jgi:hypothetical protein